MSDGVKKLSLGELIGSASQLVRDHFLVLIAYIVPLTIVGAGLDMLPSGGTLAGNIATFIAGYFLYEHLLRKEGLMSEGHIGRSFGAYLGVSILTGLATVLGFVLLVVPGLILMARWSIASGIVVAEGRSTTDAMAASWAATRASQWTIVLLYVIFALVVLLPAILLVVGLGIAEVVGTADTAMSVTGVLIGNLFAQVIGAGSFVIGVAIMQGVYRGTDELESVFA